MRKHADYVYRNRDDSLRVRVFQRETGRWDFDVFYPSGAIKTYSEGAEDNFASKREALAEANYQHDKLTPITVTSTITDKAWYAKQQKRLPREHHATKKSPTQLDREIIDALAKPTHPRNRRR
jgi:hypothetical protein